jgi:alpha-tubulin suppressor-like RCC1 family protein
MRRVRLVVGVALLGLICNIAPVAAVSQRAALVKPTIALGRLHSCGVARAGTVVCWGNNAFGQLGNNSIVQSLVPVSVHGVGNVGVLSGVKSITAGNGFSCALLVATTVDCWGYGGDGELGTSGSARSLVPVQVHGVENVGHLRGVKSITAGNGFACALLLDATAVCWGANASGELGTNGTARSTVPVRVHGVGNDGFLRNVKALSAGSGVTPCAVLANKTAVCWGANTNGELGNNSTTGALVPVPVHGVGNHGVLGDVRAVSGAGTVSSCALTGTGKTYCWGYNGSLGINSSTGSSLTPVQVHGVSNAGFLSGVTAIVNHSLVPCGLGSGGAVDCWGGSGGALLGDGAYGPGVVPVQAHGVNNVGFLQNVTAISAGEQATCALLVNGSVECWGANSNGELGNNSTAAALTPTPVHGIGDLGSLSL